VDTLKEFRRQKGWSQKDLADEAGVGQDTISGIESRRHEPRPSTLRKLAEALGVQVADFFREPALPKAEAPRGAGQSTVEARQGPLAARLLRAWRAYVWDLALRWEAEDSQPTAPQIQDVLDALQRLVDSGVFERPADTLTTNDTRELADWFELSLLFKGIDRLRAIAERAVADEEAARARSTFEVIDGLREQAGA
jgi:putative transcriptional regulator